MNTRIGSRRRLRATLLTFATVAAGSCLMLASASAAIAPTVPLGTAANYSVLGASTVTNTGPSTLRLDLGLSPGPSITGFPPGLLIPPAVTNQTNAAAANAQAALTTAYTNAQGRSIDATTTADLANKHLLAGVYAGPSKGALQLTGPLVLDGAGNPKSVFIFQTDSSLTTASSSTVTLVNGAQACNVFWQVGSSATLGTASVFTGTIMALTSITLNSAVTVHGRALARNGAVTLINDTFTPPTCAQTLPATTTTSSVTATTVASTPGTPGGAGTPSGNGSGTAGSGSGVVSSGTPGVAGPPRTDATPLPAARFPWSAVLFVTLLSSVGSATVIAGRRRFAAHPALGAGSRNHSSRA